MNIKMAIVREWLESYAGSERVLEQLDISEYALVIFNKQIVVESGLYELRRVRVCQGHTSIHCAWDLPHQYLSGFGLDREWESFYTHILIFLRAGVESDYCCENRLVTYKIFLCFARYDERFSQERDHHLFFGEYRMVEVSYQKLGRLFRRIVLCALRMGRSGCLDLSARARVTVDRCWLCLGVTEGARQGWQREDHRILEDGEAGRPHCHHVARLRDPLRRRGGCRHFGRVGADLRNISDRVQVGLGKRYCTRTGFLPVRDGGFIQRAEFRRRNSRRELVREEQALNCTENAPGKRGAVQRRAFQKRILQLSKGAGDRHKEQGRTEAFTRSLGRGGRVAGAPLVVARHPSSQGAVYYYCLKEQAHSLGRAQRLGIWPTQERGVD